MELRLYRGFHACFSAKSMKWEKMTYVLSKIALSSLGKVA